MLIRGTQSFVILQYNTVDSLLCFKGLYSINELSIKSLGFHIKNVNPHAIEHQN